MATTIYTYLHNDDLSGSRVVSMDDCMCKLFEIKRNDSSFFKDFSEMLQTPALYILLNKSSKQAYIGETDDFVKRINQHLQKKFFWDEVLVFIGSNEDAITKTEVQYLEYLAYSKAVEVNSYNLFENTQSPRKPHMNIMQIGKSNKFFEYVMFLSKFVGCHIFEKQCTVTKIQNKGLSPFILPVEISYSSSDLSGRIRMSLNGVGKYTKREMVLQIVKEYVRQFPDTTFAELQDIFRREYLGRFACYEFLQSDIDAANKWQTEGENHAHYFLEKENIIHSGDRVPFVVCVEWEKNNIIKVLGIAKALGWTFNIIR